jgi:PAS domain S-box-containing protein
MAANTRLASEVTERRHGEEHLERTVKELAAKNALLAESQIAATKALDAAEREREKFEFQLWETRKFQQAVAASSDGVIIATGEQAIIIYVNKAWEKLTGYSFNDVEGKHLRDLKSGLTNPLVYEQLWSTVTKGQPFFTEELINRRKDDTTYEASLAVSPVLEGDKIVYYVGVEQDITQRKAVERAKSEFVSLASHQLRTPLAAVRWYAEMLLEGDVGKLSKGQKSYVEEISHANKRMVALVDDLLNISRLELGTLAVEPEMTSLPALVRDVMEELHAQISERHHVVELKLDEKLPTFMADPKVLRIVIQNIISNAVKYTRPKGKITITLAREDHSVRLDVADTGIGIPDSSKERIFEKFYRADNATAVVTDGTGLGLYFAKSVIEQSHGRLWFTSEENHGTTFSLTLPLTGMIKKIGDTTPAEPLAKSSKKA